MYLHVCTCENVQKPHQCLVFHRLNDQNQVGSPTRCEISHHPKAQVTPPPPLAVTSDPHLRELLGLLQGDRQRT